ncbi:hypothetical protein AB0M97_30650 [Streptomyces sp. NPDC051207]|uniref:hypothetical protein n=1 Tax=Streptomyces sp. NPDC051207 TaxID=3154641 RepID=UPI00343983F9
MDDPLLERLRRAAEGALPADQREYDVMNKDVARLSPLKHANLNCRGRYSE